jgi:predicted  nucleic acid-binding Zn-ribbon protein
MNTFDKNMEQIFDVTPVEEEKKKSSEIVAVKYNEPDVKQDLTDAYQQSKENLQEIIDQGKEAMEEILNIAKAGQHPRAFEVYGTLLKNMVDANKELLNIQKTMRDMDGKKKEGDTKIDKAIFVGSTAELNKFLNNKND